MFHRSSKASRLGLALAIAALTRTGRGAEPTPARDLSTFFKVGVAVLDTNGDSFADAANVRFVLPATPTAAQIAGAANIAARVGLETTAMNIPLRRGPGPEIAVSFVNATGPEALALGEDEGLVRFTPGATPSLLVSGRTDAGIMAAAEYVAARLPHAWDVKGATLDKVAADIRDALKPSGVVDAEVAINEAVVSRESAARILVTVKLARSPDLVRARAALAAIAARPVAATPRLSYRGVTALRVLLTAGAARATVEIKGVMKPERPQPIARRASGSKEGLDLSTFYSIDGALGDSDNNLIPDRTEVVISAFGEGTERIIDLAARIGLESTGVSIPLAVVADSIDATTPPRVPEGAPSPTPEADSDKERPETLPMLILVGAKHPVVERLIRDKKFELPALAPGEGLIQVVKNAFGGLPGQGKPAVVVAGGDAAGVARALAQLAETFPHIAARGKDRTTVDDIEEDVRRFVQARSPGGQAATALYKLDRLVTSLQGRDLASARVKVFVEKAEPGLDAVVRSRIGTKLGGSLEVVVEDLDVQKAKPIVVAGAPVTGEMDIASEVDTFWKT
ncbi:MAG TPA: hypothetical protein PLD86_19885, partial [Vicinamibacteria bacterium]|nr:hypothetical protein [Vicinamibacteria bacterium]